MHDRNNKKNKFKRNSNHNGGNNSGGNRFNKKPNHRYTEMTVSQSKNGNNKKEEFFAIHPISEKMILRGHPWITKDKFSAKFPENEKHFLIKVKKKNGQPLAICLNDPKHKFVKARVWKKDVKGNYGLRDFKEDLKSRIEIAVRKRADIIQERDNLYLIFAEADQLPGLRVLKLGDYYLITTYSYIWKEHYNFIIETLELIVEEILEEFDPNALFERNNVWIQNRSENYAGQLPPSHFYELNDFTNLTIQEFGIKYNISLGKQYDHGLYTDMASVRKKMTPYFENAKRVLNLFSYTGAFSLYAMKNGCEHVTTVDLSQEYLDRATANIELNKELDATKNTNICSDTEDALNDLNDKGQKFDLIICDPPSSFSDGSKRSSITDFYESNLKAINEVLEDEGYAVIFCNTQKYTRKKFELFILKLIEDLKLNFKIRSKLHTAEDCPRLRGFPEGDYLKGIILKKTNSDQIVSEEIIDDSTNEDEEELSLADIDLEATESDSESISKSAIKEVSKIITEVHSTANVTSEPNTEVQPISTKAELEEVIVENPEVSKKVAPKATAKKVAKKAPAKKVAKKVAKKAPAKKATEKTAKKVVKKAPAKATKTAKTGKTTKKVAKKKE